MSDNSEILIKALEASGSGREAKLARAILGEPAQPAQAPAAAVAAPGDVPAEVAALAATLPTPPAGKAQLTSLDDWEALPEREQMARMDEVDAMLKAGHK